MEFKFLRTLFFSSSNSTNPLKKCKRTDTKKKKHKPHIKRTKESNFPSNPGTYASDNIINKKRQHNQLNHSNKREGECEQIPTRMRRLSGFWAHFIRRRSSLIRSMEGMSAKSAEVDAMSACKQRARGRSRKMESLASEEGREGTVLMLNDDIAL